MNVSLSEIDLPVLFAYLEDPPLTDYDNSAQLVHSTIASSSVLLSTSAHTWLLLHSIYEVILSVFIENYKCRKKLLYRYTIAKIRTRVGIKNKY